MNKNISKTKRCKKCGKIKPVNDFYEKKNGHSSYCRKCLEEKIIGKPKITYRG